MYRAWRKFCQFLLSSDTRKLTVKWILYTISLSWNWHVANHHCHGLYFINLGHYVLSLGQQGTKLASLIQAYTQDLWNLLDKRLWSQKGIIVLGQLLDQFLILVEFLQCLVVYVRDVHSFGLITVSSRIHIFLNQIVVAIVLNLDCMTSLDIVDIKPLPDMILAKIFSHSSGCFFLYWFFFFFCAVQNLFVLLLFCLFCCCCFCFCYQIQKIITRG